MDTGFRFHGREWIGDTSPEKWERMQQQAQNHRLERASRVPSGDSGMALFIVLVLVLVLTVVITQMVFVTQVEKRISQNRQGFVQLNYALQASSRLVMQKVTEDLMEDLGLLEELDLEGGDTLGQVPAGNPGSDPNAGPGGADSDSNDEDEGRSSSDDAVDTRHDVWAYPIQDTVNDIQVTGDIVDGESCIDLNHIFELVLFEEEEETGAEGDIPDLGGIGVPAESGFDPGSVSLDPENSFPSGSGFLEEEFVLPEQEQVDDAEYMLQRLMEAVIDYNQENGFNYEDTPDPTDAAAAIVGYVFQRVSDEKTRRIRSLDSILQLEEISLEFFEGPVDPMAAELEESAERDGQDSGMASGLGGLGLGDLPGIGSLDFLEQSGYSLLDEMVEGPVTPLGLRHVLTANSSGKINLNTARPEVIIALIPSFEDFQEAKEIAWQIYQRGDTYRELTEEEEAAAAEMPLGEDEEDAAQDFEHFTNINQLSQINEDWNSSEVGGEPSITELLKEDLEKNVVFKSQYFTANLKGTKENQTLSGKLVCARRDRHVVVLSWRELKR